MHFLVTERIAVFGVMSRGDFSNPESPIFRAQRLAGQLINKIADFREHSFTQFHSQQPRTLVLVHIPFETLEDRFRQIGLFVKHLHQGCAISGVLIVARNSARWADRQVQR